LLCNDTIACLGKFFNNQLIYIDYFVNNDIVHYEELLIIYSPRLKNVLRQEVTAVQQTQSGLRIRERRRELGIKQVDLAARVGVSAPYLNLIERNKRGIGGALLAKIGVELKLSIDQLDGSSERRLRERLTNILKDVEGDRAKPLGDQVDEILTLFPNWARLILTLHRRMREANAAEDAMADRLTHDPALGRAVHNMLTEITALRSTSEILAEGGTIPETQRTRFETIMFEQSSRLASSGASLAEYFDSTARARRRSTPHQDAEDALAGVEDAGRQIEAIADQIRRQLQERSTRGGHADLIGLMEPALPRAIDLPEEAGFIERRDRMAVMVMERFGDSFDPLIDTAFSREPESRSTDAEALTRREACRRAADALILPAWKVMSLGKKSGWDMEVLIRAADGAADLAMRRVACLGDIGGPRAAHLSTDASGRILSQRGALDLLPSSRMVDCPVWPVHHTAANGLVVSPLRTGADQSILAIAARSPDGMQADMLLMDMASAAASVYGAASRGRPSLVGSDCRICAWSDCQWRREPAVIG
jgi:transcriptional regulator with XRE-family HTH domain